MQSMRKGVALGMKYTLICKNGYLFNSDTHFLLLGEWLGYQSGYTILEHGVLSDQEYHQIRTQSLVNVYQDCRYNRMSIIPGYHDKYLNRHEDRTMLQSYAGCLKKISENVYEGRIRIK